MGAMLVVLADFTPRGDRTLDLFFGRIGRHVRKAGWPVRMPSTLRPPGVRPGDGVGRHRMGTAPPARNDPAHF